MRILAILLLLIGLAIMPATARAFDVEEALRQLQEQFDAGSHPDYRTTQGGGKSLAEAIEQVRRQTNGRILSAETKVSGNREVHHIKVLTKDGRVKTVKVQGRRRNN
jgi:uncharacterized membrane protein YkoI